MGRRRGLLHDFKVLGPRMAEAWKSVRVTLRVWRTLSEHSLCKHRQMLGDQRFFSSPRTFTRSIPCTNSTAAPIADTSAKSVARSIAISFRASCSMPKVLLGWMPTSPQGSQLCVQHMCPEAQELVCTFMCSLPIPESDFLVLRRI